MAVLTQSRTAFKLEAGKVAVEDKKLQGNKEAKK